MGMRTQPWEAGWAGTDDAPWMAIPPLKYSGLWSWPRRLTRSPLIFLPTRYDPPGVTAVAHSPCTQYLFPFPLETGRMRASAAVDPKEQHLALEVDLHAVAPPLASMGAGGRARETPATTSGVARLVRTMAFTFWKASTA